MKSILIISTSLRDGRSSHRVAQYLDTFLREKGMSVDLLDLKKAQYPLFEERIHMIESPSPEMQDLSDRVKKADAVIFVVPEYNGSFPASYKNVVDVLGPEWMHKPVAFAPVSAGSFGGAMALSPALFTIWRVGAMPVNAFFPVPTAYDAFDENGVPANLEQTNERAEKFIQEIEWAIGASKHQN